MARLTRAFLPDQPAHLIQRGNNRQPVFFTDQDRRTYLKWLAEAAEENGVAVHAYVLMTNHVHLLAVPARADSIPRALQSLGRRYVRYINDTQARSGTLWEGRYRAALIDSEAWFLECCRYIELNPVRAGLVAQTADHRWSSYAAHALGAEDRLLSDHPLQLALGATEETRQQAWRDFVAAAGGTAPSALAAVRAATNGGWALGSEAFRARIAAALGRRVAPLPVGRPRCPA
jgi:putative transposase